MDSSGGAIGRGPWTCSECGWMNERGATCDRCGVARSWIEDPPLDLPPPPGSWERPASWLALLHALAAVAGFVLVFRPDLAPFLALRAPWQWIQVALSLAAAVTAANRAAMERLFHEIRLDVPAQAPTDAPFDVDLALVPYRRIENLTLRIELIENTYHRRPGRNEGTQLRSRRLARHRIQTGAPMRGRRVHHVGTTFVAPVPNMQVHDTMAEIQASMLAPFAWLVPGLGEMARNLREHGGVRVRVFVGVGPFRRVLERRIIIYLLGGDELIAG